MRCVKCGLNIDENCTTCPACGAAISDDSGCEEIQAKIGSKIESFLNDELEDNYRKLDDGVEIVNGQMDISGTKKISTDTRKLSDDTVFAGKKVTAGKQSLNEEFADEADLDDEPDKIIMPMHREKPAEAEVKTPEKKNSEKKSSGHTGLIIGIIAAAVVAAVLAVLLLTGTFGSIFDQKETETTTEETAAADTITFSINDGEEYEAPLEITITSELGNRIYYTIDGTAPTESSEMYTDPVKISENDVGGEEASFLLKAVTYTETSIKSGEAQIKFKVRLAEVNAPEFSLQSGNYSEVCEIEIKADEGCTVYYTFDGTRPTAECEKYTGPVTMKRGNNILSAIAVKDGRESQVTQAVYNLDLAAKFTKAQAMEQVKEYLKLKGIDVDEEEAPEESSETTESKSESNESQETSSELPTEEKTRYELGGSGTVQIDENVYYVFDLKTYKGNSLQSEDYFGADDQTCQIVNLTRSDKGYVLGN